MEGASLPCNLAKASKEKTQTRFIGKGNAKSEDVFEESGHFGGAGTKGPWRVDVTG